MPEISSLRQITFKDCFCNIVDEMNIMSYDERNYLQLYFYPLSFYGDHLSE